MHISDYIPFDIIKCLYFLDLTHLEARAEILAMISLHFLKI
jgi:hypothetical protein